MQVRPVGRFEWEQILRRMRVGGLIAGSGKLGKDGRPTRGGIAAPTFKAIALVLATYGDLAGAEIYPGDAAVAVDVETSLRTVRDVRAELIRLGMLQLVAAPAGRNGSQWRLSLPVLLPPEMVVLNPAQHKVAAKRVRDEARGKRSGSAAGTPQEETPEPDRGGPEDTPETVRGVPADHPTDNPSGGSIGHPKSDLGGSVGHPLGGSDGHAYPTTDQATVYQANSGQDHFAAVTLTRATDREQDQISPPQTPAEAAKTAARAAIAGARRKAHPNRASPKPGPVRRALDALDTKLTDLGITPDPIWKQEPA
jgi:hypothetical protein